MATENLQNHFFIRIFYLKFLFSFWRYIASEKSARGGSLDGGKANRVKIKYPNKSKSRSQLAKSGYKPEIIKKIIHIFGYTMKTTYMKLAILNLFSPSVLATDNLQYHCFLEFVFKKILISHFGDISPVKKWLGSPSWRKN